jgi:hypothetical protein
MWSSTKLASDRKEGRLTGLSVMDCPPASVTTIGDWIIDLEEFLGELAPSAMLQSTIF